MEELVKTNFHNYELFEIPTNRIRSHVTPKLLHKIDFLAKTFFKKPLRKRTGKNFI